MFSVLTAVVTVAQFNPVPAAATGGVAAGAFGYMRAQEPARRAPDATARHTARHILRHTSSTFAPLSPIHPTPAPLGRILSRCKQGLSNVINHLAYLTACLP